MKPSAPSTGNRRAMPIGQRIRELLPVGPWVSPENRQSHSRQADSLDSVRGRFARVIDESIVSRHDDASGEAWLHGRFTYMLYR